MRSRLQRQAHGLPSYRVTTAHLQAAYPFMAAGGLGGKGVYIGQEVLGGAFCYDPWELYGRRVITNPNMLVAGQVGRGKSSFVKGYLWRQQVFGRRARVIDPKGEYGALAKACGSTPIRVGPRSAVRLNPLDAGPDHQSLDAEGLIRRRTRLLTSLAAAGLDRRLSPTEQTACELAIRTATRDHGTTLVLPHVVDALLWPEADAAEQVASDPASLAEASKQVALQLRRLCRGDLAGMFDAPTSGGIDLDARLVVLDLSELYGSDAQALVMLCASAWLQTSLATRVDGGLIDVTDEAWAVLGNIHVARWMQASFKLARDYGVANMMVVHRLSDLSAAGAAGSEQAQLAAGLMADTETRVIFAQSASEVGPCRNLLGLSDVEADLLPRLSIGVALWRVGVRGFLVSHRMSTAEHRLADTDARMV